MTATPRPWRSGTSCIVHDGKINIAQPLTGNFATDHANTRLIIRAVNSHDAMIEALEAVLAQYELHVGPDDEIANETKRISRAALKLAKGET